MNDVFLQVGVPTMTLFIIGGTGFVGRFVTRRLADRGHAVMVFHRGQTTLELPASVTTLQGDRDSADNLRQALDLTSPEVVVDLICYTRAQATALAELCSDRTGRLVVISSGDVYRQYDGFRGLSDHPPDPVPLSEGAPRRTSRFPYRDSGADFGYAADYDKILVEDQVRGADIPSTVLRLPKVYGPYDGQNHVGEALARLERAEGHLVLGPKEAQWQWSRGYVDNVATAVVEAATQRTAGGTTFNVGEPGALPQETWLKRVASAADIDVTISTQSEEDDDSSPFNWTYDMALDTRRIRTELGFAESVSHDEALRRTIAWERNTAGQT